MRLLVTGAAGFVGPHAIAAVRRLVPDAEIFAAGHSAHAQPADGTTPCVLDVVDTAAVSACITQIKPTHVLHLAGVTTIAAAANNPEGAWAVNLFGTVNVLRAMISHAPGSVFVLAGSGQVYGESARSGRAMTEADLLRPDQDYAASKAAADLAAGALAKRGVRVVRMRPFNHTGPGQPPNFAVPEFADQIARIEAGHQDPLLHTGNLDVARDFLDVRDVASAYALALVKGWDLPADCVLNVASGNAPTVRTLLDHLLARARTSIRVETDPTRVRAGDLPVLAGNAQSARDLLGWEPSIPLETMLDDVLADARRRHGLPS